MNDEGPRIVSTTGGLSVVSGRLWLYSRYAPAQSAARLAEAAELQNATLYVIPSPCLGYGLDILLARLPAGSALLCVELDRELSALCAQALAPYRGEARMAFVEGMGAEAAVLPAIDAARRLGRFRRVTKLRLNQGEELHASAYQELVAALEEDISTYWRNKMALVRMSRLWTKNFFFNLGAMDWSRAIDAPSFDAPPAGTPRSGAKAVAVCGAGTSLDLALDFLREAGPELHVMACDTAAGALAKAGVRVDSLVCLEGQVYNVADFLPLEQRRLLSFIDLSAHPSSFRAVFGPLCVMASRWQESSLHERFAATGLPCLSVDPLGSVGVLALHIARRLSAAPLFVIGLDFRYPQGRTHCLGSPQDIAERARETRRYKGEGFWKAGVREGAERASDGFVSDPALNMYASLASRELRLLEPGRMAYDLRQGVGTALPAQPVDFKQARAILAAAPALVSASLDAPAHASPQSLKDRDGGALACKTTRNGERARAFLEGELRLASRLRDALRDGSEAGSLAELVRACDYMFAHFPDPERVEALELDALKRLAAEASYWASRLRDAVR